MGLIPQVGVLKVGVLDVRSKPFAPHGEARSWEFAPNYTILCQEQGLWQECVSALPTRFNVGILSFAQCV